MNCFYNIKKGIKQLIRNNQYRDRMNDVELSDNFDEENFLIEVKDNRSYDRKKFLLGYLKRLLFMYTLNIFGYMYLHFVSLSHGYDIDLNTDDLIFFLILPIFSFFPINHLLSKGEVKHYGTYVLGFFNGVNFSVLNNIGNLDKFVLDTNDFKYDDPLHVMILLILIIFCCYSIFYTLKVSKKRKLVSFLIFSPIIIIGVLTLSLTEYTTHIHHYVIALFLVLISYHPRYLTIIINSVSFGVYLEGIVQWGYAPIFYKKK